MKKNEEFWNASEGDFIEGELIEITDNIGKYSNRIYKIRTENKIFCIWESVELKELFENVERGDRIYLKYIGTTDCGEYYKKNYELKIL
ncbi:MAG: hypothetical protein BZ133_06840 [Methanosphaera sp. SHI613]|jgi:hypothetical protein|nr:MAG: hypothetical protein BZ133_06840 [Methanosphaera sp. SHI613]